MRSNICVINKGGRGLDTILDETKKVTDYNGLQGKDALRLRLLAEELVGMLPKLVNAFEACFWVQNDGKCYELHTELSVSELTKEKKAELIGVSANKKNAAASGFMGKIRDIAENMLLCSDNPSYYPLYDYMYGYDVSDIHYTYAWSLEHYVEQTRAGGEGSDEWDRLEKSIVAKLADDVIVGVRGTKVEIIIKKEF